jgi:anaerobic ribonucleoside-triphosphate reductase activating protein
MKFYKYDVVFQEIPNEITLAFEITNCTNHCDGCHSPWLQTDIGETLTPEVIQKLLDKYKNLITTVLFLGGKDCELIEIINQLNTELKIGVYSGNDTFNSELANLIDFYKIGHYDKQMGGLDSKTTNQRFFVKNCGIFKDMTYLFQGSDK